MGAHQEKRKLEDFNDRAADGTDLDLGRLDLTVKTITSSGGGLTAEDITATDDLVVGGDATVTGTVSAGGFTGPLSGGTVTTSINGDVTLGTGGRYILSATSFIQFTPSSRAVAGSAVADATAVLGGFTIATGATSAATGVKMPASPVVGTCCIVYNNANATMVIYPNHASANINGGSDGAGITVAAYSTTILVCVDATTDNQVWSGGEIAQG